ncbi:hypothetical protein [Azonexus sp. IMCC34839]|uniref:hypothetical protein n=1 Tax=Azonexus sp. IMCC34839 TaxID=3133695 RepID=UPI00399B8456
MAILKRSKAHIVGLVQDLNNLSAGITAEKNRAELAEQVLTQSVADEVTARQQAVSSLSSQALKKSMNLSDLPNKGAARTALEVMSATEVTSAINAAKLALGTNYTVADNAARDALTGLDSADTVTVTNGGNWVKYGIESVTNGVATFFVMSSKAEYENAQSAAAIKAAYESNDDTNAFTDAEKSKVGFISVTKARDLDKAIQSDELNTSPTLTGASDTDVASSKAVKEFVEAKVRIGGAVFASESIVVANDKIVLSAAPKDGVIFNFGLGLYVDVATNEASYVQLVNDATDVSGKTFTVSGDAAGDFNGKSLLVQYPYVG